MPEDAVARNPNEELAELVVDKLVAEGSLPASRRDEVHAILIAGGAKARDWPAWIVAAAPRQTRGDR